MNRRHFLQGLTACGLAATTGALARADDKPRAATPSKTLDALSSSEWRRMVRFADTLLERGRDKLGAQNTLLLAAVIDTRDMSVPRGFAPDAKVKSNREVITSVPPLPGVREGDRAVGGSNLLHDAATVRFLSTLSQVSGQPRYRDAALGYCREFLGRAQNSQTGLLAWGEHLFYDLFADKVSVHPYYSSRNQWPHELLGTTPPWELLWQADAARTARAIAGLRLHFYEPKPDALFNRHAHWDRVEYQKSGTQGESQPWIKHSALFTHAFAFLYAKSGDEEWLRWARATGDIYWNARNPRTGLTPSCLTDPRPQAQMVSSGQAQLAYWLYRAFQLCPRETAWRDRAVALFLAYDRAAYSARHDAYLARFPTDGSHVTRLAADKNGLKEADFATSWLVGYGDASTLPVQQGRIAAHLARAERNAECLQIARRIHRIARKTPLHAETSVAALADALHLGLDLHDLSAEPAYLRDARFYADEATARYWRDTERGGLLARADNDPYYEAKAGSGDLASGLLRLSLQNAVKAKQLRWEI